MVWGCLQCKQRYNDRTTCITTFRKSPLASFFIYFFYFEVCTEMEMAAKHRKLNLTAYYYYASLLIILVCWMR